MKLQVNSSEKWNRSITKQNNRNDFNLDYFNLMFCIAGYVQHNSFSCFTSVVTLSPLCVIDLFDPSPVSLSYQHFNALGAHHCV